MSAQLGDMQVLGLVKALLLQEVMCHFNLGLQGMVALVSKVWIPCEAGFQCCLSSGTVRYDCSGHPKHCFPNKQCTTLAQALTGLGKVALQQCGPMG